jgi:hypothetical protein
MTQYKVLAFTQWGTNAGFGEKLTQELSDHARFGWRVEQFHHGWSGWYVPTVYVLLRRDLDGTEDPDALGPNRPPTPGDGGR